MRRATLNYLIGSALIGTALAVGFASLKDRRAEKPAVRPQLQALSGHTAVVARAKIQRGEAIKAEDLASITVTSPLPAEIAVSKAQVIGAIAIENIIQGQFIGSFNALKSPGAKEGLSLLVPEGMRAVALRITDDIAVGNFVRPGDRVDILVRITPSLGTAGKNMPRVGTSPTHERLSSVLLQNVEVLSIGAALNPKTNLKLVRAQTVTVAVTPTDANRLNLTGELGSFYLALRNPQDKLLIAIKPILLSNLLKPVANEIGRQQNKPAKKKSSRSHTITVITGGAVSHVKTQDLED